MPARDTTHAAVRVALERDGWTITADPFVLPVGLHNLYVDLAAERVLAAERGSERIAVESKSFVGRSEIADLEQALGSSCSTAASCVAESRSGTWSSPSPRRR